MSEKTSNAAQPADEYPPVLRRPVRPKYQVFVSSTFQDLREEREAVTWAILKAGHIPVGMENFSAYEDRGWKVINRTLDTTDYYVLILAGLYGSIDDALGISWTEREYRRAIELGIPVLAFIREKRYITGDQVDHHNKAQKLADLISDVSTKRLRETWTTTDDLRGRVGVALLKAINEDEADERARPGWYRGNQLPSAATLNELASLSAENRKLREKRLVEREKVHTLRWNLLSEEEQADLYREFLSLKPQHHKPRGATVPSQRQRQLDERNPIDLGPLRSLLSAFRIPVDAIRLPLTEAEYSLIHECDIEYANHISDETEKGLTPEQRESIDGMYDYLSCTAMPASIHHQRACDVVVVPGARKGLMYRADEAFRLTHRSNCTLILSGNHPEYDGGLSVPIGEAEAMYYYLTKIKGLDPRRTEIICETRARTTRESTIHVLPALHRISRRKGGPINIGLVTSPYHMRRFLFLMRRALEGDDHVMGTLSCFPSAASFDNGTLVDIAPENRDLRRYGMGVYVQEFFKLIGGRVTGEL